MILGSSYIPSTPLLQGGGSLEVYLYTKGSKMLRVLWFRVQGLGFRFHEPTNALQAPSPDEP